ncbi:MULTISPECIES: single-stranded DNA-binding protein [Myroides]|uniref:Single-stranded DNA-binding protein n=1 Tax=Myroides albus TaxID=2562892 RepID=A0A6I3LHJ3_9FLAO|nr:MULTISPECIES: single-stranded DNA-binding protein [Myroides]MTG96620.1 single-stranded DNA-binding protein [Myroides albus]MVX35251.1 single-stranded DNA-binding protein [Myroides sp. LoEW2-1]UVD80967.1 single-stranded DNA-binding protein [Myroides albus]
MSSLKNRVQLIGRIGQDPEIKRFEKDSIRATFSIAINEVYYNEKNERVESTQWHNVVAWGKVAEIVEKFASKGREVAIEGKLVNRTYTDSEGNKKYITEVVVGEILLLGSK